MVRAAVVEKIRRFVETIEGLKWRGCTESPIKGPAGNVEYLALIEKEK
jgi:predicted rRNA methylase YqxC with S4 and FtsJ domains